MFHGLARSLSFFLLATPFAAQGVPLGSGRGPLVRVAYTSDERVDNVIELFTVPTDGSAAPLVLSGTMTTGGDVSRLKQLDSGRVLFNADALINPKRHKRALDNLAIAKDGTIYVSNMAEATIYAINPADGAVRKVVSGPLATPTDLVMSDGPEGEKLHVADVFTYRVIDTATKAITDPLRMYRDETENQLGIGAGKSKVLIKKLK